MQLAYRLLAIGALLVGLTTDVSAQFVDFGGGEAPIPQHSEHMSEAERDALLEQLTLVADSLRAVGLMSARGGDEVDYAWPLQPAEHYDRPSYFGISNFVDHDPAFPNQLLDYQCGARTYDLPSGYNHRGLDAFTWPYGWALMDDDAVEIVAAADGVILLKSDGHYDRQCTFNNNQWNAVYLGHDDGSITWYGHMKNGSLTSKGVGESVERGEYLGIVGSSGSSTGPHIHWEVYGPENDLVDPYAGTCNDMNEESLWVEQPDYYLSYLNAIITHTEAPSFPQCPDTHDVLNESNEFELGDTVYIAVYYRDQLSSQPTQYRVVRPSGTVMYQWTHSSPAPHFAASYWFWAITMPGNAEQGIYTFEASFNGELFSHSFSVGQVVSTETSGQPTPLTVSVFPNPVRDQSTIHVTADGTQPVQVQVFDLLGREVVHLSHKLMDAGTASIPLDATGLAPGTYIVRADAGTEVVTSRLLVIR